MGMQPYEAALGHAFSRVHVNARAHEFCVKVVGTMCASLLVGLLLYRLLIKPALRPHHVRRYESLDPGAPESSITMVYEGEMRVRTNKYDMKWHGKGTLKEVGGQYDYSYHGEWVNGERSGWGRQAEAGGSVYVGYFEANQKHGDGTCTGANGSVYTGQWDCDKMHGRGKFTAGDGSAYTGDWYSSTRHGQGVQLDADGGTYVGQWVKDLRHGQGRQTYPNGSTYDGSWFENKRVGMGSFSDSKGRSYKGRYVQDKRCGPGHELSPLSEYEGDFIDGLWHGKGKYVAYRELSMFALAWQLLTGGGSNRRRISHTYEGCWKEGKMSGRGRYVDYGLGGYVYDGEFDKGKMSGRGRYAFHKGSPFQEGARIYEGDFAVGKEKIKLRHGRKDFQEMRCPKVGGKAAPVVVVRYGRHYRRNAPVHTRPQLRSQAESRKYATATNARGFSTYL